MKTFTVVLGLLVILAFIPTNLSAQTGGHKDDPAVQRARADMEVAQDLGRLLGFINQMVQGETRLALNQNQTRLLHTLVSRVLQTTRLDRQTAEDFILQIEDSILTPAQLLYTDRLFAARETTRIPSQSSSTTGTGTPQGNASGRTSTGTGEASSEQGTVTTYMNGGPYNPLNDITRQQGQDVKSLLEYLSSKL